MLDKQGLQKPATCVNKIVQLHETLAVRFGAMLVGPAGSGKSTLLHTLKVSLLSAAHTQSQLALCCHGQDSASSKLVIVSSGDHHMIKHNLLSQPRTRCSLVCYAWHESLSAGDEKSRDTMQQDQDTDKPTKPAAASAMLLTILASHLSGICLSKACHVGLS